MLWLPTWEDARGLLQDMNVSDREVAEMLMNEKALDAGNERLALYGLLLERLQRVSA